MSFGSSLEQKETWDKTRSQRWFCFAILEYDLFTEPVFVRYRLIIFVRLFDLCVPARFPRYVIRFRIGPALSNILRILDLFTSGWVSYNSASTDLFGEGD